METKRRSRRCDEYVEWEDKEKFFLSMASRLSALGSESGKAKEIMRPLVAVMTEWPVRETINKQRPEQVKKEVGYNKREEEEKKAGDH